MILAAGIIWVMNRPEIPESAPLDDQDAENMIEQSHPEIDFDPGFLNQLDQETVPPDQENTTEARTDSEEIDNTLSELDALLEEFSGNEFEFNDDLE